MNEERIRFAIAQIETSRHFDMAHPSTCIIGHSYNSQGHRCQDDIAMAIAFEIHLGLAGQLAFPQNYPGSWNQITKEQAVNVLRRLMETGEVKWEWELGDNNAIGSGST